MYIFPPQGHGCIFSVYFFKKKDKKPPTQRLKFCILKGKSVSILQLKTPNEPFCPRSFFQFQMYHMKKTILPSTACLASFYSKDNFIITLLQSTVICVQVNSSILNSFSIFFVIEHISILSCMKSFVTLTLQMEYVAECCYSLLVFTLRHQSSREYYIAHFKNQ